MLVAESGAVVATAAAAATLLRFRRPCDQEAQRDVGRAKSAGGVPHQHAPRERVRAGAKRTAREGGESREDAHRDGDAGGASLIHVAVLSATGARPVAGLVRRRRVGCDVPTARYSYSSLWSTITRTNEHYGHGGLP